MACAWKRSLVWMPLLLFGLGRPREDEGSEGRVHPSGLELALMSSNHSGFPEFRGILMRLLLVPFGYPS